MAFSWNKIHAISTRFAELNGWSYSPTAKEFTMQSLAGKRGLDRQCGDGFPTVIRADRDPSRIFDHIFYFRKDRRPAAIVTMPYHGTLEDAKNFADKYDLDAQSPPIPKNGWWFPGSTHCFVFVERGTKVHWLPEQQTTPAAILSDLSKYLKDRIARQSDPAPDGAAEDFSTVEISTSVAKEIVDVLDALRRRKR